MDIAGYMENGSSAKMVCIPQQLTHIQMALAKNRSRDILKESSRRHVHGVGKITTMTTILSLILTLIIEIEKWKMYVCMYVPNIF